jgi:hypothetical protein
MTKGPKLAPKGILKPLLKRFSVLLNFEATMNQKENNVKGFRGGVRERLIRLAGRRITEDGLLIVNARRFRTQERNLQDAIDRLVELVPEAAEKRRPAVRQGRRSHRRDDVESYDTV